MVVGKAVVDTGCVVKGNVVAGVATVLGDVTGVGVVSGIGVVGT